MPARVTRPTWSLTTAVKAGTSESLYVGGQPVATQSGKVATIQRTRPVGNLGRGYDDTFFPSDIAKLLVHDRALTTAERGQLEQYLLARYGGWAHDPPRLAVLYGRRGWPGSTRRF